MLNQEAMQVLNNNILPTLSLKLVGKLMNVKKVDILFHKVTDEGLLKSVPSA